MSVHENFSFDPNQYIKTVDSEKTKRKKENSKKEKKKETKKRNKYFRFLGIQ